MGTFNRLKKLSLTYASVPGLHGCKEYEIVIEIGYHQEIGSPLTLKQLLLLNIASPATVRRHLASLVREGVVERRSSDHDRRKVHLALSHRTIESLCRQCEEVERVFAGGVEGA